MAEMLDRPQNLLPPLQIIDYSSPDKPDNYRISPITPTSVENKKEDSVFEDWSGRGSHVDFTADETVPLVQGRFLGHGVNGGVWETHCKGVALAWKRKYCRRKIGDAERKEITILKKLSHNHIVKLVGTYTYRQFLGLLLWPVAVCDMATFFEDFETVLGENCTIDDEQSARLTALGLPCESQDSLHSHGCEFLYPKIGCLASAIAYLHEQKVRHKDLKPSNVLLSRNNLWVTDFGTSTDFSLLSTSATEDGERGTPKYFAPEVAAFKPNGRSADVFSLGCIFLEILTAVKYGTLRPMRMSRPAMDGSFQSNLNRRQQWLQMLNTESSYHKHLLCEIEDMLNIDPQTRPTALEVKNHLAFIDQFRQPHVTTRIFGFCCATSFLTTQEHSDELESLRTNAHIRITSLQKQIDTLQAEARKMRDEQELHMQMCQSPSIRGEEEPSELQGGNFARTQSATSDVFDVPAIKSWISRSPSTTFIGEVAYYWTLFNPLSNGKGFIMERAAKSVFYKSKLSPQVVDRLWRNIDIYNTPVLDFTRFCVVMHWLFGLIAMLALCVGFWMVFCEGLHSGFPNRLTIKSQVIFANLCRQSKMIVHPLRTKT
ncbi:kinase-like protein [Cenococcum geophilum 1.58]|uniref:kinase-like protein n=1 Tax=Cenococcum geophilum 1.58 TaxID=794803 RepID=UPI00358F254C|nr:kinase-like protein [Cenococcum geophilum 1.58]